MIKSKLMKGLALAAIAVVITCTGCEKSDATCTPADPATEEAALKSFMDSKGIVGTKSPQGVYYQITAPGSTSRPTNNSILYCTYKGTTLDGTVFDQQTNPGLTGFSLSNLIEAWKFCIPYIGKGGSIKIVTPSKFAYGCTGSGDKIPANTPLYFEINLVDFF